MNYYPDFKNYNLFVNKEINNNYANQLYEPYNGLIRGNLFKNLYSPYKTNEPYEIKTMNEQAKLLTDIDALGFAMIDLNLYLDVFPNDTNKINLFNQYKEKKSQLLNEYESKFGPINLNSNKLNFTPWAWNNMPWPWDN